MNFDSATWWLVGILMMAAVSIIGYFLSRTMDQMSIHGKTISEIQRTYATKDELKEHKDELKEYKNDIKQDITKIHQDISLIKDKVLYKSDYLLLHNKSEEKMDRIQELLMKRGQ